MQAIDPTVAAHYWDYTIDAEEFGDDWSDSFFMKADMFGPLSAPNAIDHSVGEVKGRFSGIELPNNYSWPTHNGFGFATTPWNNNPSRLLTRSTSICGLSTTGYALPGCQILEGLFTKTNMTDFHLSSEGPFHTEMHSLFGGVWSCEVNLRDIAAINSTLLGAVSVFANAMIGVVQALYQNKKMTCPKFCSSNMTFDDCRCSCPALEETGVAIKELVANKVEAAKGKPDLSSPDDSLAVQQVFQVGSI